MNLQSYDSDLTTALNRLGNSSQFKDNEEALSHLCSTVRSLYLNFLIVLVVKLQEFANYLKADIFPIFISVWISVRSCTKANNLVGRESLP